MVAVRGWRLGSVLAIPVQSFFELLDLFEQNPNLLLLETDLFEEKRALRKKKAGDLFRIGPQKMKKEPLDQEREWALSCPTNTELWSKKSVGRIRIGSWTPCSDFAGIRHQGNLSSYGQERKKISLRFVL